MPIIIKEITIRTTIERPLVKGSIDTSEKYKLKKELLQEVKEMVRREVKRINER